MLSSPKVVLSNETLSKNEIHLLSSEITQAFNNTGESMRPIPPLVALVLATVSLAAAADYPLKPVPFNKVKMTSDFWRPRLETQRKSTTGNRGSQATNSRGGMDRPGDQPDPGELC